jgi:hypothetical protein
MGRPTKFLAVFLVFVYLAPRLDNSSPESGTPEYL